MNWNSFIKQIHIIDMECGSSALIIAFSSFLKEFYSECSSFLGGQFSSFPVGIVDIFPTFHTLVGQK